MSQKKLETAIQVYVNDTFGRVRGMLIDGKPYFVGKDVAEALGYVNTKDALIQHVDAEDQRMIQRSQITTLEMDVPNRGLTLINESGLYSLIFSSKLEGAKAFKHWVTSEVLPSIHKTGGYNAQVSAQVPAQNTVLDKTLELARLCSTDPELLKLLQSVTKQPDVVRQPVAEKEYTDITDPDIITVGDLFQQYIVPVKEIKVIPVGNGVKGHSASALYHYILKNFHDFMVSFCNHQTGVSRNKALILKSGIEEITQALIADNSDPNARL